MSKKTTLIVLAVIIVLGVWIYQMGGVNLPGNNPGSTGNNVSLGECYVGGCSGHICSDSPDVVSTCEYREEYACYQSATCERQVSGECGWTQTQELQACLSGAL